MFEGLRELEHQLTTADDENIFIINYNSISVGYLPVFLSAVFQSNKTHQCYSCPRTVCSAPDQNARALTRRSGVAEFACSREAVVVGSHWPPGW